MERKHFVIFLSFILAVHNVSSTSRLEIRENLKLLNSSEFGYPNNTETLDVLYLFDHSITLDMEKFHLNGHDGDFILISEYPLLNVEVFKEKYENGETDDGSYVSELAKSIITEQGVLMSWKAEREIDVLNDEGNFILFHTEAKDPDGPKHFEGFLIHVKPYDPNPTPPPPTTRDPVSDQEQMFISKFLNCMEPLEFYKKVRERNDFQARVAKIANEYCNETEIELTRPIIASDIFIPKTSQNDLPGQKDRAGGIHYCDTTWELYDRCVEVTFTITTKNEHHYYIFTQALLEDMWSQKAQQLEEFGYCPYDPPGGVEDLSALGPLIFALGMILALIFLLGVAWLKNTKRLPFTKLKEESSADPNEDRSQARVVDRGKNPILNFVAAQREDHRGNRSTIDDNYDSDFLDEQEVDRVPEVSRRQRYATNSRFQNVPNTLQAYDNRGFHHDVTDNYSRQSRPHSSSNSSVPYRYAPQNSRFNASRFSNNNNMQY